jgi:hypothetical protein
MGFVRYVSMTGPVVYVLIPALSAALPWKFTRHVIPAAVLVLAALFVSDAYTNPAADPRDIAAIIPPQVSPRDVIVFASSPECAMVPRYAVHDAQPLSAAHSLPCPVSGLNTRQ